MKSQIRKVNDPGYARMFRLLQRDEPVSLIKTICVNVNFDEDTGRYRATSEDIPFIKHIADTADDAIEMFIGVACIRYLSLLSMPAESREAYGFTEELKTLQTYLK